MTLRHIITQDKLLSSLNEIQNRLSEMGQGLEELHELRTSLDLLRHLGEQTQEQSLNKLEESRRELERRVSELENSELEANE
jgi:hypothetical protein